MYSNLLKLIVHILSDPHMGHHLIKMLTPTEYSYNQINQDRGFQPFWIYVVIISDIDSGFSNLEVK